MKARMEVAIDTLWSNQVTCSVEAELDNPHTATTRHLGTMMAETLQILTEELRSENERAATSLADLNMRHRHLDDRELALERREEGLARREHEAGDREHVITAREDQEAERGRS